MTRTPFLALLTVLLVSGCSSTGFVASWNDGADSRTATNAQGGWGTNVAPNGPSTDAPTEAPVTEEEVPAGACYVKAPKLPSTADKVQVLKRPERRVLGTDVVIPAEYVSVAAFDDSAAGFAWLPSICEDDADSRLIMRVQQALIDRGYDIGAVDGIDGPSTQAGLEYFKRDKGVYGDGLTYEVLRALGIKPQTSGNGFAATHSGGSPTL
ncbi:MAG: hypothetical protein HKN29_08970 [Rhodothermales bacterium]|nr:hypothetical protein [Rhodothermales bacterium]